MQSRNRYLTAPLAGLFLLGHATLVLADDKEKEPESASDAKPKTVKVTGILEAVESVEITSDAEHLKSLELKRIVAHGTRVSEGRNVVWFKSEEIDEQIKDAERAFKLARIAFEAEIFAHDQFVKTQELDSQAAELSRKDAQQKYDNFVEVDRERQIKSAKFSLKSSKASLENAREELNQLEQMYKEDDLTEESEEIVLKRARQSVDSAEFRYESAEIQNERVLQQQIPRSVHSQEEALTRAELAYEKRMRELDDAKRKHDIEMDEKKQKFSKEEDDLAELKEERKQLVLTGPVEGIALHGKLNRGKIAEKPSTLKADSKVTAGQVLLTIVNPRRLQIRVDLAEENLSVVKKGAKCSVTFPAYPDVKSTGVVRSVSLVPYAGNKFDCVVALQGAKEHEQLLPTMKCQLEFEASDESRDE